MRPFHPKANDPLAEAVRLHVGDDVAKAARLADVWADVLKRAEPLLKAAKLTNAEVHALTHSARRSFVESILADETPELAGERAWERFARIDNGGSTI